MSAVSPELVPLDAPTLVEASAGTGKTYAITTYFVRAILEEGLAPESILVVTYTKAATAELRVRARGRIIEALSFLDSAPEEGNALSDVVATAVEDLGEGEVRRRLRTALGQMDQAAILTIHGFCQRLLQEHPLSFGVELELEVTENVTSVHADLAVDFWAKDLYDEPEWLLQALRDRNITPEYLTKLANVASMPGVEVIGPDRREIDDDAMSDVLSLHRQTSALWFEHRGLILDLLDCDGLYASIYKKDRTLRTWAPELDQFFSRPTFRRLPKFFQWLCSSNMAEKTKKGSEPPRHRFFDACERLFVAHARVAPMLDYAVYAFQERFCEFVRRRSEARRDELALFSFDDLLTTVHEAVSEQPAVASIVRSSHPLALVDEFQDTDSIQYGIFRAIYGDAAAVYVGDPKQAIYAFRGADIFSYLAASKDVGDRTHTLATNRRSDPGVVHAVNALFSRLKPPFLIDGIDFHGASAHEQKDRSTLTPSLDLVLLEEQRLDGPLIPCVAPVAANEVALLLESDAAIEGRPIEPGDVAVLCRTNRQAIAVTKALRLLRVPTSLDGDASVLNTDIASDLSAVLEATLMPGDSRAVRRALLTSLAGVSPFDLASMGDELWSAWVARFREWNERWHQHGVLGFLTDMLTYTGGETAIASGTTARRDLTDLLHLQELLLRGERDRGRDPVALMQWFRRLNEGTPDHGMVALEELQQRPDAQAGSVRVTTVHKSKGLEYGVVFCPFTWNDAGLFQFEKRAVKFHGHDGRLMIDLGSANQKEHLEAARREAASEALRLLYVAITRAKHQCTIFWGPRRDWKDSALGYVLHDRDVGGKLDDQRVRADVAQFVAGTGENVDSRRPRAVQAVPRQDDGGAVGLEARARVRTFDHSPRIASFTSLTGHDDEGRGPALRDTRSPLFEDLPGGARTGLLLHSILEHVDLGAISEEAARASIERLLSLYGFDVSLATSVQRDVAAVASTPMQIDPILPSLAELRPDQRLRELEFTLSVGHTSLRGLCELLQRHGAPSLAPEYHERLGRMDSQTLRGFLRGFIDLMFEWEGRWYVADYKSNRLADYLQQDVIEAVQREHYVLQGELYAAAAHRYLRQRVPGYEPDKHWGGALFLFVRGMTGSKQAASSVFFERQKASFMEEMDEWLGGDDGSR